MKAILAALSTLLFSADALAVEIFQPAGCAIKGNVGRNKSLFYLPGHPTYERVKINKNGERWFCTEKEALAAGWKPAGSLSGRVDQTAKDQLACSPSPEAPAGCAIKGNINKKNRIYHVPCSKHYEVTEIRPEDGERWFCSEIEAKAAGWRKPRG
jgi:hypothetical protein